MLKCFFFFFSFFRQMVGFFIFFCLIFWVLRGPTFPAGKENLFVEASAAAQYYFRVYIFSKKWRERYNVFAVKCKNQGLAS